MKKITVLLAFILFCSLQVLHAQRTITGTVTSAEDGSALPGVSIVEKGTTNGVITDMDGKYKIEVDGKVTLVFTFVGMQTKEVITENSTTIDVVMQPADVQVADVVVTAIGIKREKKALGYTVQDVNSEEISKSSSSHVINSIAGKVAGVRVNRSSGTVGSSSFIEIRGAASLTGSNRPLFVVDGVPIDGGGGAYGVEGVATGDRAGDLNPDDIESMSVLKGGAATALYGLRAANGAIIITTKKGRDTKGKIHVNVHSSVKIEQISQVPELQSQYAQGSYLDAEEWFPGIFGVPFNRIGSPDGPTYWRATSWGPSVDSLTYTTDPDFVPFDAGLPYSWDYVDMETYMEKWDPNGRLVYKPEYNDGTVPERYFGYDPAKSGGAVKTYDPYDYFQNGKTYSNHISLSGGNSNTSYYFSFSNTTAEGVIPENTYNKNTFKISAESKLSDKLTVSTDMSYLNNSGNRIQQGSNLSGVMLGLLRTPPTFDNSFGYKFPDGSQRTYRGGGGYDNPYWISNEISYQDNINRFIGNTSVRFSATDWLSLTYRAGTDWYSQRYKDFFEIGSNNFPNGYLQKRHIYSQDINSDFLVNINKALTPEFDLSVTLGQNMYQREWTRATAEASGLLMQDWPNMGNTDANKGFEASYKKRTAALFASVDLAFKDMIFASFTGRNEWSTTMPEEENSFFFPSASVSFIFTELAPLQNQTFLNYGKFYTSYAITALDATAYSTSTPWWTAAPGDGWTNGINFPYMGYQGFTLGNTMGNVDLKPELMKSFEVGIDLKLLQNKLRLNVAYFKDQNEDQLLSAPIAASTGYDARYLNAASMETSGIELLAGVTPVKTSNLTWDILINFSNPTTEVTSLAEGAENVSLNVGFVDPQLHAIKGEPYRTIWGTRWLRDDNGDIVIDAATGYPIQDAESGILGSVPPNWTMGITNSLSYKGVSLNFLIDIKNGGQMWNGTKGALYYFGKHKDTETRDTETKTWEGVYGYPTADGVQYTNAAGEDVGSPVQNSTEIALDEAWYYEYGPGSGFTGPSEQFIEDTDWVRLREITLSYMMPSRMLKNIFLKKVEVYFTGYNLWLSTPYTGVDPETSLFGTSNAQGADYFNQPGTKSYTFGLKLAF